MKTGKGSGDEPNQRAFPCPHQEKSEEAYRDGSLIEASGRALAGASEPSYLERKALAAQGIWGRVKEMPSGCWEWQGSLKEGYGTVTIGYKKLSVHRLILGIFNGSFAADEQTCHSCNNPKCCNPKHLVPGVAKDNAGDRVEKEIGRRENVSASDIEEMRSLYASGGWSLRALGRRYGVSFSVIKYRVSGILRPDRKSFISPRPSPKGQRRSYVR